jgi:hypothetical protein
MRCAGVSPPYSSKQSEASRATIPVENGSVPAASPLPAEGPSDDVHRNGSSPKVRHLPKLTLCTIPHPEIEPAPDEGPVVATAVLRAQQRNRVGLMVETYSATKAA